MDYRTYEHLAFRRQGRRLDVILNRPDALNAVNNALHEELGQVFYDIARDDETDVVILTGAGRAFCAGGDLAEMKAHIDKGQGDYLSAVTAKRIVFSLLELEKPVIARINGHCMGLGATLALLCDMTVAVSTAKIGDPHIKAGVVAGDGGGFLWPALVGFARAKEALLLGDAMTADDAVRIGLINRAVPAEALDATVDELSQKLLDGPRDAIRWTKITMNLHLRQLAQQHMDAALAYEWHTFRSADHAEAVQAFTEKRSPRFNRKHS
ncbi:MAG: enoyl-CoA hydratase-related protein [Moraxellaceae bacterium]|nr:enoyl-CoA hydratase-related protein [Moraxellaceae bacterium]